MKSVDEYCVFSYRYRDAANYKAGGRLLLAGPYSRATSDVIRQRCDMSNWFVAEQVGIPTLYDHLYAFSQGPTSEDVAFHEFDCICPAMARDVVSTRLWGTVDELIARFRAIKHWDCGLSPHNG